MRKFATVLIPFFFSTQLYAAPPAPELDLVRQLTQAGASQLALKRVENAQPAQQDAGQWLDWERMRLTLLAKLNQPVELLARVANLPKVLPPDFERQAYELAAKAAVQSGQGETARTYLARLFWRFELSAQDQAALRQLVVESYLTQGKATDAYPLMLRYQQDFPQIDKHFLTHFVEALLNAGMEQEAATWLGRLDDTSPLKLMVQLRAGLTSPEAAAQQARTALAKKGDGEHWGTVLQAASLLKDGKLDVEAREQLLNQPKVAPQGHFGVTAENLWQSYLAHAEALGNQAHLLVGEDAAWTNLAAQLAQTAPVDARALWAYLVLRATDADQRKAVMVRLVNTLAGQKLGLTAVRLFQDTAHAGQLSALPAEVRYPLGQAAFDLSEFKVAALLWKDLAIAPPPPLSWQQWQLKRAEAFIKGETYAEAVEVLRSVVAAPEALPQAVANRVQQLALELNEAGQEQAADQILQGLLPLTASVQQKDILFWLGKIAENRHEYRMAGEYYLRAAIFNSSATPDPLALMARLGAATNLARAGLKHDARMQYQIVLRATKDAGQQEAIRRALSKL
jgi:TolA-binding protein